MLNSLINTEIFLRQTLPITFMMDKVTFIFVQCLSLIFPVEYIWLSIAGLVAPTGYSIYIL